MEELLREILASQKEMQETLEQQEKILQQQSRRLDSLQKGQTRLESRIDFLDKSQLKLEDRIENEIIEKIRALYDARSVQEDINSRITDTLDRIEAKLEILQMERISTVKFEEIKISSASRNNKS